MHSDLTAQNHLPAPPRAAAKCRQPLASGPCPAQPSRTLRSTQDRNAIVSCNWAASGTDAEYRGKDTGINAPWQKIKFGRQIASIARVAGAKTLYTNDGPLKTTADKLGMNVIGIHELPIPNESMQIDLIELLNRQTASMNETDNAEVAETEEDAPEPGE